MTDVQTQTYAIVADKISHAYDSRIVLKQVSLSVSPGECLCLCGTNGAGKSTLLRIISGLLSSTSGAVSICDTDLRKNPLGARRHLGVISHRSMLYADLTVLQNLRFAAELYGMKKPDERIKALLEAAKLGGYLYDRVKILSRGMLQRLAICRALLHEPKILLADEPFTGLDITSTNYLLKTLGEFTRDGGAVILTTHETHLGLRCSDRVAVLDGSRIIYQADVADLDKEQFALDYLAYARGQQS